MTAVTTFGDQVKAQVCGRVRSERVRVGLSQAQVARRIEVTDRTHVAKWEAGEWQPSDANLQRLAELFERPGYWWFYLPDDEAYG